MSSSSPAAHFLSAFFSTHSAVHSPSLPDDEGQSIAGYTLGPVIGYGATSIIRKVSSSTASVAAVKIIRRADLQKSSSRAHSRLQREAAIWAALSHEHILPLFTTINTDYADYFFTLYCPAGSLFDILKRDGSPALLHDDAGMMFRQVVRGLRYLHDTAHYVHRDIKLENVLVDDMGICKIGDFGMAKKFHPSIFTGNFSELDSDEDDFQSDDGDLFESDDHPRLVQRASSLITPLPKRSSRHSIPSYPGGLGRYNTIQHRHSKPKRPPFFQPGSLPYAAPELLLPHTSEKLRPRPHPGQDIWALGVLLYALLTGKLPFMDSFEPRLQMKILSGQYDLPNDIGLGAERILKGCLERNIHNRWTIAMVDEVAWGVGWSAAGGPLEMHDEEDEHEEQEQQERLPTTAAPTKKKKNGSPVDQGNMFVASREPSCSRSGSRSHSRARYHPTSPPSRRRSPSRTKPTSCPPLAPIFIPNNNSRSPSSSSSRHHYYRTHRSMSRSDSLSTTLTFSPAFPISPVDNHVIEGHNEVDEWVLDPVQMRIQPWLDVEVDVRPDRGRRRMRDDPWDVVGVGSRSTSISPIVVAKPVNENVKERGKGLSPSLSEHS